MPREENSRFFSRDAASPQYSIQKPGTLLIAILAVAVFYFLAAKLGFTMAFTARQVSLVWPPSGIALAAILLLGFRVWPAIAIGAFLANVTTHEPVLGRPCNLRRQYAGSGCRGLDACSSCKF